MNRSWKVVGICGTMLLIWSLSNTRSMRDYLNEVKAGATDAPRSGYTNVDAVPVMHRLDPSDSTSLLYRIRSEAEMKRIAPVDARLDRIWKAIPGYNGLEVDIERTYLLAKEREGGMIPFVYKQIPPQVSLDDLGAQPIYKGNPNKPMVSLMINVAWGDEFLPVMLEILNKENVHATFFFDGSWLKKNMDKAKAIGEAGHELSNHAYSHPNMSSLSRERAKQEIVKTEQLLRQLGVNNKLFAPPSGDYNEQTVQLAHELGLRTILWTIDTVDWKNPGADNVVRRVAGRLEPGALILMHPTESSSKALASIINEIKRKGLVIGTVSELLSAERVPASGDDRLQKPGA